MTKEEKVVCWSSTEGCDSGQSILLRYSCDYRWVVIDALIDHRVQ